MALRVAGRHQDYNQRWLTHDFPTHPLSVSKYFDSNQPHLRLWWQVKRNIFYCGREMWKSAVILATQGHSLCSREKRRVENATVKGANEAINTKIRHNADGNQISIHQLMFTKVDIYSFSHIFFFSLSFLFLIHFSECMTFFYTG